MKIIIFCFALNCICLPSLIAQNKIDSLKIILKSAKEDTNKVKTLCLLSDELEELEPAKAIEYANEGIILAKKISFKKGISICLNALGNANSTIGEYKKAFNYYEERYRIAVEMNDSLGIAGAYDNIGIIYYYWGNIDSALKLRKKAITIYSSLNDEGHLANGYIWVGNIYMNQSNYVTALEYFFKGLEMLERGNDQNTGYALVNISNIYRINKQYEKAKKFAIDANNKFTKVNNKYGIGAALYRLSLVYIDETDFKTSIKYLLEAKKLFEEIGEKSLVATTNNLLGDTFRQMGDYNSALVYLEKALTAALEINNISQIATTTGNIGTVYKKQRKFLKALKYFYESEVILSKLKDKKNLRSLAIDFVEIYSNLNQPDSVLKYFNLYQQLSDTIYSEQSSKAIAEMQTKFETQKKTDSLILQQNLISFKDKSITTRNYFLGGLIILALLITGLFILSRLQSKKISNQYRAIQQLQSELTHRTGNFFNSIKGMLAVASATTTDSKTISSLNNRVGTINRLFNTLYSSPGKGQVNFSALLESICSDFEHSFGKDKQIRVFQKCSAAISKQEAVPLAFIITELLTNAEKYAFEGKEPGEIHVEVAEGNDKRILHVWDNGKGKDEIAATRPGSQGTAIVKSYSKNLGGAINTWNDDGYHFKMEF